MMQAQTLFTALLLTLVPLCGGWLVGLFRRRRGQIDGAARALAAVIVPASIMLVLDVVIQVIGVWDALYVGALFGVGILVAVHRAFADWTLLGLALAATAAFLFIAEIAGRFLLPPAPAFPSSQGPALLMSNALAAAEVTGYAPTQAGLTTCDALYDEHRALPTSPPTLMPAAWKPRPGARRRVLHLGDSMVFGSPADGRFTDELMKLEPDVEHVNAAIAGTAPDVYLALTRRFVEKGDFDAVVLHLTGNDYWGVDQPQYPCSDWQPLLVYGDGATRLRFPAQPPSGHRNRFAWFMQNSPPPYLLRAGVQVSTLAAHAAAALIQLGRRLGYDTGDVGDEVREAHLAAILRDARAELDARRIPLIVDSFWERHEVQAGAPAENGSESRMKRIAERLGITTISTWQPLLAAVTGGMQPFSNANGPNDSHFNPQGHAIIAGWLHEELPRAIERERQRQAPAAG